MSHFFQCHIFALVIELILPELLSVFFQLLLQHAILFIQSQRLELEIFHFIPSLPQVLAQILFTDHSIIVPHHDPQVFKHSDYLKLHHVQELTLVYNHPIFHENSQFIKFLNYGVVILLNGCFWGRLFQTRNFSIQRQHFFSYRGRLELQCIPDLLHDKIILI